MSTPTGKRWTATFPKDRRVVVSDGTSIAYTVRGDGPRVPVAFVNGWTCPDSYWEKIGPAVMAGGHPVVYLDLRGHGDSGLPRDPGFCARNLRPEDVSAERLARDVAEVIEAAGFASAALVGHSMGVQAIIETARVAPERVAALIPIAGTFENPVRTFADLAFLDRVYPIAETMFRFMPFELLRPIIRRTASPEVGIKVVHAIKVGGPKVTAADMAAHLAHVGEVNFSVLFKMMSALRSHHTAELLPQITQPTLVLAGRKDLFTPPSVQSRMAELIPGAEIVWFEEGGHLLPIEESAGVIEAMVDFLGRLDSARLRA
ncbi:MAG: alpha/beta fold hydrolase [Acidimicrobiales bacterium]